MNKKLLHQETQPINPESSNPDESACPQSGARIQVTWETSLETIDRLEPEWLSLEERSSDRTVFACWDYMSLWYRHYSGVYGTPLVGVARRDGELVGVAALVMRKAMFGGIPLRRVDFAGYDGQAGEFLTADNCPEAAGELISSLMQTVEWDVACFGNLPPGSPHLLSIERVVKASRVLHKCQDHAYAMVDLRDGAEAHWGRLDGKIRRNLKRVFARANSEGATAVDGLRFFEKQSGSCESVINRAIALTNASHKMREAGREMSGYHQRFYHALGKRFAKKDMLDVAILTISGTDAAFLMALVDRNTYYDVTVSFAEKFKHVFPGIFLMHELLRQLPGKGIHTVVSHGAYEYKRNWATRFVPVKTVYLANTGVRARLGHFSHFMLAPPIHRLLNRFFG